MTEGSHIPIIKLYNTLIISIQVELSDRVVMQLKDDIGAAIEKEGPRGLIIDVSGVDIMDSYISRAIRDIGLIARLMGVDAVISGLDPNVAMTLVEMGMDLEGVAVYLHLEAAFEALHDRREDVPADNLEAEEAWWSA